MNGVVISARWIWCLAVGLMIVSTAAYQPGWVTPRADRQDPVTQAVSGQRWPSTLTHAGWAPHLATPVEATVVVSGPVWIHQSTITNTIVTGFFGASVALSGTTA